jgi:carbamoyl-phosphate synthase large subunit
MDLATTSHREGSALLGTELEQGIAGGRSLRMMLSSAGRRVSLLRGFREAAGLVGADLTMVACDMTPEWSPACIEADQAFAAPPAESAEFIPAMLDICKAKQIGLLVPTIDTELLAYSQARDQFSAIGCHVAVSDEPIVQTARDKLATANFLAQAGLPSPRTISLEEFVGGGAELTLPLLAKPRHGSSSRGIMMVQDRKQLHDLERSEPYILQEYLQGREFTISLYFDGEGSLKCAVPHERLRVRSGEVEKGVTVRDPALLDIAWRLGRSLKGARGAMCFQVRMDASGQPSIFEINARFGGGYPLAHQAGANFARWILEERLGLPSTARDDWQEGVLMLRFDDAVFV